MHILCFLSMYVRALLLSLCLMKLSPLLNSHPSENPLLLDQVLAPMENVRQNYTRSSRGCSGIPDPDFLRLGFLRTLSQARSGRDFLQQQQEICDTLVQRSSFFDCLHSERRLQFLSLIHISEPTRRTPISYAVFCLKKTKP